MGVSKTASLLGKSINIWEEEHFNDLTEFCLESVRTAATFYLHNKDQHSECETHENHFRLILVKVDMLDLK